MKKSDIIEIRDQIVNAFLPHVMFDGWEWRALVRVAVDLGHDKAMVEGIFPEKILSVLEHFSDMADREMLVRVAEVNPLDLRVQDRVKVALMARFEYLQVHKEAVRESVCFLAWPTRKPRSVQMVWATADAIWGFAGDEAQDYNRYTKRGLLSAIIVPTTLVWLDDMDEDMYVTREFLDRRVKNVVFIGRKIEPVIGKIKKVL